VVNGGGDQSRALIGDMIGLRAKNQGLAGFVIDGAVRDADALADCGLPVFAEAEKIQAREAAKRIAFEGAAV
jgi:regulator of RNase E activity RraA